MIAFTGLAEALGEAALIVTLVTVMLSVVMMFRARAMRAFAERNGFQYVGPLGPKWLGVVKIKPALPISRNWYPANEIRQAWNVIQGAP